MACTRMELRALFLVLNQWPYETVGIAFEATPRTLAQNCGVNVVRAMTALQGKHVNGENAWKYSSSLTFKTAIESACLVARIDDIVSGRD
ncbi:hypothetical protein C1H46_013285 [Malus baccata]|uniref:Uncharacterized protein n=1 Tax=Malus baccata TaxID=106549 RepID=A0A540MQF7_MALBA|nr:hypothetical protein C1H46_013285 [Malus baccata]